jgi:hypothetical protein
MRCFLKLWEEMTDGRGLMLIYVFICQYRLSMHSERGADHHYVKLTVKNSFRTGIKVSKNYLGCLPTYSLETTGKTDEINNRDAGPTEGWNDGSMERGTCVEIRGSKVETSNSTTTNVEAYRKFIPSTTYKQCVPFSVPAMAWTGFLGRLDRVKLRRLIWNAWNASSVASTSPDAYKGGRNWRNDVGFVVYR